MAMVKMSGVLMVVSLVVGLVSVVSAISGTATYYTPPYVPSSCNGYQNDGVMIAAASDAIWNNRAACGRMYRVTCVGPTNQGVPQPCRGNGVIVKIVDYCPPGCAGTIDLSQEAFAMIADPNAGKITIEYNQLSLSISC
ncbi:Eg45-like domain containing protein [Thalictrum thalictroides]|uniref:Eg45-like domain containing protein n=1 Tax=Thalictrum thalictroides TaxID=46969 RepID=A0A7J6WIF1_THATH|nr:Eg45-like domain containing protein [Thalictrum thalictroides]